MADRFSSLGKSKAGLKSKLQAQLFNNRENRKDKLPHFNPRRYSPRFWLDASDTKTLTLSSSGRVSEWRDKSGNALHASQASGPRQPLFKARGVGKDKKPAIQFYDDLTYKLLSIPDGALLDYTAFTVFVVFQRVTDTGATERICGKFSAVSPANQREFSCSMNSDTFLISTSSAGALVDGFTGTTKTLVVKNSAPYIGYGTFTSTARTVRIDNELQTQLTGSIPGIFAGTSPFHIGARDDGFEPFSGFVSEILFYNQALTVAQCQNIYKYLKKKWY